MGRFIKFGLILLTMKKLGVFLLIVVFAHFASSAHWISGFAEDALDSEGSDGKEVVMWNPLFGSTDNVSDIVGVLGMSGVSGVYLLDCEMLGSGCVVGNILSLKIFGTRYISWVVNVTVSGAGYDVVGNLSLNSPPSVSLVAPENFGYSDSSVDFNCSFADYDDNVVRIALWGNWSGGWSEKAFVDSDFDNNYVIFSEDLVQGSYKWNCFVEDDLGIGSFDTNNNSFFVDATAPFILDVSSVTDVCGFGSIPIECSVSDNIGVGSVVIRARAPNGSLTNYSASFISGNIYRANVDLDEAGIWGFECFGFDIVENANYSVGDFVTVGSLNAEISFVGEVNFDKSPSVEGEVLNVSVNMTNVGCVDSGNFTVGFFDDDVNFWNATAFIGVDSFLKVYANWSVNIGSSEILIYADLEDVLDEDNESNNEIVGSTYLKAWQGIYGNVSLDLVLAGEENKIGAWDDVVSFAGNVFVTDSEANVEWNNLQAVGRTKLELPSSDDFSEIDSLLGMSFYNDSLAELFSSSEVSNFSVFGSDIENVAYVNSSSNGNFITGVLWDMSDSVDLEYDSSEGEDVVFVAKINGGKIGTHGVYDYEIIVPSKLRGYDNTDEEKVYLYYDLR